MFKTGRGVIHGEPVSPTVLNSVVDAVVRAVLLYVFSPQESHHSIGWVLVKHNINFYADDSHFTGRNTIKV